MAQATRTPGPGTTIEDANAVELIAAASSKSANVSASWKQVDRPGHVVVVTTLGAIGNSVTGFDIEIQGADDSSGTNPVSYGFFDKITGSSDNETRYLEMVVHKPYMAAVATYAGSGSVVVGTKVHAIPHKGRTDDGTTSGQRTA